jgi:beta-phosphoglucomutase-like phosphatase (HAD superfamily)
MRIDNFGGSVGSGRSGVGPGTSPPSLSLPPQATQSNISMLHSHQVKTAVVTSSNIPKMESVYRHQPGFMSLFDAILTSEDFERSKPDPDCYLKAAQRLGAESDECIVFEDSFNGLRAGRAAGMAVVGMATTNGADAIQPFSDLQLKDYEGLTFERLEQLLTIDK